MVPASSKEFLECGTNTYNWEVIQICREHLPTLTSNLPNIIKDKSHLLDLIDNINKSSLPDKLILVFFDIMNMFPNRGSEREMEALRSLLDSRSSKKTIKRMLNGGSWKLLNNNSHFPNIHLLQTNGTATGAPNWCSYSDIATSHLDKIFNEKRATQFQECFCFGRYRDDCLVLCCGDIGHGWQDIGRFP